MNEAQHIHETLGVDAFAKHSWTAFNFSPFFFYDLFMNPTGIRLPLPRPLPTRHLLLLFIFLTT
jgi:hypothetical protein